MVFVVIRASKNKEGQECCIVKAESAERAKSLARIGDEPLEWAGFTDAEFSVMTNAKEGYIAKDM